MTKVKKEKVDGEEAAEVTEKSYQELIANVNPIAQPLASKKLSKKLYKCVKKGKSRADLFRHLLKNRLSLQNSARVQLKFTPGPFARAFSVAKCSGFYYCSNCKFYQQ